MARLAATIGAVVLLAWLLALTPSLWSAVLGSPVALHHWHRSYVLLGALSGLLLLCLLHAHGWLQAILGAPPLRMLGIVSFSAYLWHPYLLDNRVLSSFAAGGPVQALGLLLVLIAVSAVSHVVIERPFLRLGRG